ncbi:MAG: class I SAM-dependent methyltransferase [Mesonia hippocampi]|uniref:class I SAM-dependent methyltransferase n=1 Tax=Mesonia hippocampi TaxID=1628250 RepID=UPI003F9766CC
MKKNNDIFGNAVLDFYHQKNWTNIMVHSPDFDDDEIPTAYLFRNFSEMPILEQKALQLAAGKTLDVGACAGSHSLYLQEKNIAVKAIDLSKGAIEVCKLRGIKNAENLDFFDVKNEQFDTILMLMNGSGIIGKMKNLNLFFTHLKTLLTPHGKVLLDSSDLQYLFDTDEDGGIWVNPNKYYGELTYQLSYKGDKSEVFDWLYIDFNSLALTAETNGFQCKLVKKGQHYDYLAVLTLNA